MEKSIKKVTMTAALDKMGEILGEHAVEHPVRVQFPVGEDTHDCWEWQCHDVNGTQVCEWVKVKC